MIGAVRNENPQHHPVSFRPQLAPTLTYGSHNEVAVRFLMCATVGDRCLLFWEDDFQGSAHDFRHLFRLSQPSHATQMMLILATDDDTGAGRLPAEPRGSDRSYRTCQTDPTGRGHAPRAFVFFPLSHVYHHP